MDLNDILQDNAELYSSKNNKNEKGQDELMTAEVQQNVVAQNVTEDNNNVPVNFDNKKTPMWIFKEVSCGYTDDDHSNASSLESKASLTNNQGSFFDDETESRSTSCSEDSFEMSSSCNIKDREENRVDRNNAESLDNNVDENINKKSRKCGKLSELTATRKPANREKGNVISMPKSNTDLPDLDFEEIGDMLSDSVQQNKLTTDRVKSFVETIVSDDLGYQLEEEYGDVPAKLYVHRSKSLPGFEKTENSMGPKKENLNDIYAKINKGLMISNEDQILLLFNESCCVMKMAAKHAEQFVMERRRHQSKANEFPRQSRQHLSKTKLTDIRSIHDQIEQRIKSKNADLVKSLMERDNLHMEHDSLKIDIDDFTKEKYPRIILNIKKLLSLQKELYCN